MGLRVILIAILIKHIVLLIFFQHHLCQSYCAIRPLAPLAQDNLCTKGIEEFPPLDAHALRHNNLDPVAFDPAEHPQGDTRVTACRLKQDPVMRQFARFLGPLYHGLNYPIFYAPGRIKPFKLCIDPYVLVRVQLPELHHRCIANSLCQIPIQHYCSPAGRSLKNPLSGERSPLSGRAALACCTLRLNLYPLQGSYRRSYLSVP